LSSDFGEMMNDRMDDAVAVVVAVSDVSNHRTTWLVVNDFRFFSVHRVNQRKPSSINHLSPTQVFVQSDHSLVEHFVFVAYRCNILRSMHETTISTSANRTVEPNDARREIDELARALNRLRDDVSSVVGADGAQLPQHGAQINEHERRQLCAQQTVFVSFCVIGVSIFVVSVTNKHCKVRDIPTLHGGRRIERREIAEHRRQLDDVARRRRCVPKENTRKLFPLFNPPPPSPKNPDSVIYVRQRLRCRDARVGQRCAARAIAQPRIASAAAPRTRRALDIRHDFRFCFRSRLGSMSPR
jgi:hypothetical protein